MRHIESGETAAQAMWRELHEETGLAKNHPALRQAWALEGVHPFYVVRIDAIFMCPRFAVEVGPSWEPELNAEHSQSRWVPLTAVAQHFMWPGQLAAIGELVGRVLSPGSLCEPIQRVSAAR